jgi:amidase
MNWSGRNSPLPGLRIASQNLTPIDPDDDVCGATGAVYAKLPVLKPKNVAIIASKATERGYPVGSHQELLQATACEIVDRLRRNDITPHDLLDALEARIGEVDGKVNALPTLCFDRARAHADALSKKPGDQRGLLAGLPVPIKDLTAVEGVLTTHGSPIFRDHVPAQSDILVGHLEANGALIYAKSNTSEFGAGANTFNEVFGATRNPWDLSRSVAGSSGGAAAALASGTAWVAHGSDMGGSLRNPASFCGVVGLRPSIGRVARTLNAKIDGTLGVQGSMARNIEDVALLLDAMSGEHAADPLSLPQLPASFLAAARSGKRPRKIAYSPDLGITPVDPEVAGITRRAAQKFAEAGVIVEEAHPDLREAHECFQTLRAFDFAIRKAALLRDHRDLLKPELIWNIEKGLQLTVGQIEKAEAQRIAMTARTLSFFETYDLLLAPATIVPAFPVEQRYLAECAGHKFENYIEWLAIVYAITLVFCPALSMPCGFTKTGLPVGLQIVAAPRAEAQLLAGAKILEDLLGFRGTTPIDPRSPASHPKNKRDETALIPLNS